MLTTTNFFDKAVAQQLRTLKGPSRWKLINEFWSDKSTGCSSFDDFSCEAILEHIASELDQVRHHRHVFAAQNFDSTFAIIQIIKNNISTPYEDLVSLVFGSSNASMNAVHHSIELSVRIWLTINVRTQIMFIRPISAGDVPLDWGERVSLEQLLQAHIGESSRLQRQPNTTKLDPAFTATFLINTCGLRLRWSDDIANHLKFDPNRFVLTVYRHRACLVSHLRNHQGCPIPKEVLEEMLETMDLLFPPFDLATRRLLAKEGQQLLYTLGCHKSSRILDIAHYQYFGHTLEELMQAFDKTPRTWKQLAFDRRNKLEWSAFWVTVMVGILTLVSIPCNIIQATYSVKAYNVALAQGNNGMRAEL
ncbi:hypothetical protein CC86DRAFT_350288 [Ophiobolus disseminans]|uniref:Uncharacterized protein n=1 Tax=Ophiobolus disseminans TaxID=1469910 RepID=A0A6A7A2Q1_9PLEO|nr:hypothetical protein CC86DRAFT_350288 [Ophiobolus disseminans]